MHGIASGIAPDNEPLREKKVRFARFASPHRGRESGGSILLLSRPPSRPVVFEERQLNYLATTTWALKYSQLGHASPTAYNMCFFNLSGSSSARRF